MITLTMPELMRTVIMAITAPVEEGAIFVIPAPGVMPGVIPGPFVIASGFVSSTGAFKYVRLAGKSAGSKIRLRASALEIRPAGGAAANKSDDPETIHSWTLGENKRRK